MSDVRCRACGAALPAGAEWCSLCFADLRPPPPEPVPEPEVAADVEAEPVLAPIPVAEPVSQYVPTVVREPVSVPAGMTVAPPAALETTAVAVAAEPTWPCPRCQEPVPISMDECHICGAGFLAGATTTAAGRLPMVGDVSQISQGQRLMLGVGVAMAVMLGLILLATVGAKIF